ncbi:DUF2061 domain-containing protein [Halobacterium zhouii]|uniref:DUF2061 domain-containing protein n=1 Tax=Halobacterium zhouii TaxID=2902624 RepID=UPI001E43CDB3|nr:DUF2061 domain-containing protein [Halobacterium zhouii]
MLGDTFTRSPLQERTRAVTKTVVYRLFMVAITFGVALAFTHDLSQAVNIGVATNLLKTGTYYVYERAWDHVSWGVEASTGE